MKAPLELNIILMSYNIITNYANDHTHTETLTNKTSSNSKNNSHTNRADPEKG